MLEYPAIVKNRNTGVLEARAKNPIRWSRHARQLPEEHIVTLNSGSLTTVKTRKKADENAA